MAIDLKLIDKLLAGLQEAGRHHWRKRTAEAADQGAVGARHASRDDRASRL